MEVVDKTWYKELEYPDTFYTNVTDLKLLDHLTEFFGGIHTFDAANIPQLMKTLFADANGIPQFINAMKAAQRRSKQVKLVIQDEYMHAVALKFLLRSGEYETKRKECLKLPADQQTCEAWKTTCREAYVAKRRAEEAREGEDKLFGFSAVKKSHGQLRIRVNTVSAGPAPLPNHIFESLEI